MFKFLKDYVKPYWKYLILVTLLALVDVYIQIDIMEETKTIIDVGIKSNNMKVIDSSGLYMITLTILYGIFQVASSYFTAYISASVTCDVREGLFDKMIKFFHFHHTTSTNLEIPV